MRAARASVPGRMLLLTGLLLGLAGNVHAEDEPPDTAPPAAPGAKERAAEAPAPDPRLVQAARVRQSVVRIVWHAKADHKVTIRRHAVVVSEQGHLLMGGPPPDREGGYLIAHLPESRQVRARVVTYDAATALTLLHVPVPALVPITLAPDGATAKPAKGTERKPPLRSVAVGAEVTLVSREGAVAFGRIRAQDLRAQIVDPNDGSRGRVTSLVEASLAAIASDLGAPWFDSEGRVVGLLVGGIAQVDPRARNEAAGMGLGLRAQPTAALAVPASVIRIVLPLLRRRSAVPRAYIGLSTEPAGEAARIHVLDGRSGHIVRGLSPKGPAMKAGLEPQDIIVSVNGYTLRPGSPMHDVLLPYRPGETITLGVVRGQEERTFEVLLGARKR